MITELPILILVAWTCVVLMTAWITGCLLLPSRWLRLDHTSSTAVRLASGLIFCSGVSATLCCSHFSYLSLAPLGLLGISVFAWTRAPGPPVMVARAPAKEIAMAALIILAAALLMHLPNHWIRSDGSILLPHPDCGYYMEMVLALPEARAASAWSITLGSKAVAASSATDLWYHWGMIYLAVGIGHLTGLPPLHSLMGVACSATDVTMLICATGIAGRLTGTRSLPLQAAFGCASLMGMQWLHNAGAETWLQSLRHAASVTPIVHNPVGAAMPYKFEAVPILAAILALVAERRALAALFTLMAALGSPHVVATAGVMAGPLLLVALMRKDRPMARDALAVLCLIAGAWGLVKVCGGSLPKNAGGVVPGLALDEVLECLRGFSIDMVMAIVTSLALLPGLVTMARDTDASQPAARFLGWLSIAGIPGSYLALHLLHRMPDRHHVVMMPHTLIILPVALWGYQRLWSQAKGARATLTLAIIALSAAAGIDLLVQPARRLSIASWTTADIQALARHVQGRPIGYIASRDRGWWIPKHSYLGALAGSRCLRVNPIDETGAKSQFYGGTAPLVSLPPLHDESFLHWTGRFIKHLDIRHLIETEEDPLPQPVKEVSKLLFNHNGIALYELPEKLEIQ